MIIREYNNDDWTEICRVHDSARPLEVQCFMPAEKVELMRDVAEEDGFFDSQCFVAYIDSILSGFICIDPPELTWLYVDPELHRKGIGSSLYSYVEPMLGKHAWLTTPKENSIGVQFYHNLGFVISALFPGHCQGYSCTCLRMVRPGSKIHDLPPHPATESLLLAGYTNDRQGTAVLKSNGVWEWQ